MVKVSLPEVLDTPANYQFIYKLVISVRRFEEPWPHRDKALSNLSFSPRPVAYLIERQRELTHYRCPCTGPCKDGESGLVVGFVIVKEYDDSNAAKSAANEANPSVLQEFTDYVRQQWNLGACENSVLITVAVARKQYGVSIGENAGKVLNETDITDILEDNFRDRNTVLNVNSKLQNILYMYKMAIEEEIKAKEKSGDQVYSVTDPNSSSIWYTVLILCLLIVIIIVISLVLFVVLRHKKENDDVSVRDVWTKKFWLKSGNQYKEAKQSESADRDVEKDGDDEVKAKLASTEDLKDEIQYPKLSKV